MKSPLPVVSICVVTYNHEKFIAKCLDGVLMQKTSFPIEAIVGDDCSSDRTREIILSYAAKYPDVIKPSFLEKNVGAGRNHFRNVYPKLTGKYIAICDGDDCWTDPMKLQRQVDLLEKNPGYVMCFHKVNTMDQHGNLIYAEKESDKVVKYSSSDIIHLSIPTLSVVYRNCVQTFPEEICSVKSGDTFLFGMLSTYGGAISMGMVAANYRIHTNGVFQGQPLVNRYRYALQTRRVMARSEFFSEKQKSELRGEVRRRKIMYIKKFVKTAQFGNLIRILNA